MSVPKFITTKQAKSFFGLSRPRLIELVFKGYIRSIKLGEKKQASRLFNSEDIEKALDRLSMGKTPKKMKN